MGTEARFPVHEARGRQNSCVLSHRIGSSCGPSPFRGPGFSQHGCGESCFDTPLSVEMFDNWSAVRVVRNEGLGDREIVLNDVRDRFTYFEQQLLLSSLSRAVVREATHQV